MANFMEYATGGIGAHARAHDGGQHHGLAIGGDHGAVGLTGHATGFEHELAPAPFDFFTYDLEHFRIHFPSFPQAGLPAGESSQVCARPRTIREPVRSFDDCKGGMRFQRLNPSRPMSASYLFSSEALM